MGRPATVKFYEIALPEVLSENQSWLREYHKNSSILVNFMKEKSKKTNIVTTIHILTALREYLLCQGIPYSYDNAEQWLKEHQTQLGKITLRRLNDVYRYGVVQDINGIIVHHGEELLKDPWDRIYTGYIQTTDYSEGSPRTRRNVETFAVLYTLQNMGIRKPEEITFEVLGEWMYKVKSCSKEEYRNINRLERVLQYMADKGMCTHALALFPSYKQNADLVKIEDFKEPEKLTIKSVQADSLSFPTEEFAVLIPDYINSLRNQNYDTSYCLKSKNILQQFLVFLEMNNLGYHSEIASIWLNYVSNGKTDNEKYYFRRTMGLFESFIQHGDLIPQQIFRRAPLVSDSLPQWCKCELSEYLNRKKREGWSTSTLDMQRNSVTRFCFFLVEHAVSSFAEVTPDLIIQFNQEDKHETSAGKNAYNVRIRSFLEYLELKHILPFGIHNALLCTKAPQEKLVVTLTKKEKNEIENNESVTTSYDLRMKAIMLIGLKMGLRESDIVRIKLKDIDWNNQTIQVSQQKTACEILQPMPTNVANAIYRYIKFGRPNEKTTSEYLFVKDRAPYDKLNRIVCYHSLKKALPERHVKGSGFHVTRKTFATDKLNNGCGRTAISELLGHQDTSTLSPYLQMNDSKMRQCPISLDSAGLNMEMTRYEL